MASRGRSRWDGDDEEGGNKDSADALAQRPLVKEQKRLAKEERARKADEAQRRRKQEDDEKADSQDPRGEENPLEFSNSTHTLKPVDQNDPTERASKRVKTSDEGDLSGEGEALGPRLLSFPAKHFGRSRNVEEYERLNEIEEGSYGLVSRGRDKATGTIVALKKLKMDYSRDGFPVTGLREIQILMATDHPHVVFLREVVVGASLKE